MPTLLPYLVVYLALFTRKDLLVRAYIYLGWEVLLVAIASASFAQLQRFEAITAHRACHEESENTHSFQAR